MSVRWYSMSKEDILTLLSTDPEKGLSRSEAVKRLKEDGKNTVHPVQRAPVRGYIRRVMTDLTALLMLGVALLSLLYTKDPTALVMLVLLFINYLIVFLSYLRAQDLLEDFGRRSLPTVKVKRGGKLLRIDTESVVQGDIIFLTGGDIVPCDCRILEDDRLWVSESILFGVNSLCKKSSDTIRQGILKHEDAKNLLYASTVVFGGRCKAVATATGEDALVCKMGKNRPIAAAHKLDIVADLKKLSGALSVAVLFPVFILTFSKMLAGGEMIGTFLASLAYAVSAMPEQYVSFAYVILAIAVLRLAKEKNGELRGAFIKNPQSLPELCALDCLMIPTDSLTIGKESQVSGICQSGKTVDLIDELPGENDLRVLRYAIISTGLYGAARLNMQSTQSVRTPEETALIEAGDRFGVYNRSLEERYPILEHRARHQEGSAFETTLVEDRGVDLVILRGDPESLLARCVAQRVGGQIVRLTSDMRLTLENVTAKAVKAHRHPIAVASKISNYNNLTRVTACQTELVFEGFIFMERPLLPDVAKELRRLRDAGIKVFCYSDIESEENRALARALGIVHEEKNIARMSLLESAEEGIFRAKLKDYTLFEGFDGEKLQYTVSLLKEDYGYRVGFLAEHAEWMPVLGTADVCFSTDDGQNISKKRMVRAEVRDAFWKTEGASSYQALSHFSDVILPKSSLESGDAGVCGMSAAIRTAGKLYRNIHSLLFYLTFTGALRLILLLFSVLNEPIITPVQMLTAGLIFDFLAVFVIAFEKAGKQFYRYPKKTGLKDYFVKLLPATALGAVLGAGTVTLSGILARAGWLEAKELSTFVFAEALLLSATVLTALLRSSKKVFSELRFTTVFTVYTLLIPLFLAICVLIPDVGTLFGVVAMKQALWWILLLLPTFLFTVFTVVRKILNK